MVSPRRTAQFGLFLACLSLASCLVVLIAGGTSSRNARGLPGMHAPDFTLFDTEGHSHTLSQLHGKIIVLQFSSVECPVSRDYADRLAAFAKRYADDERVVVIAVNSNVVSGETRDLEALRRQASALGYSFPTLIDPRAQVAENFGATYTPTFFVIGPLGQIQYRGSFDDNRDPTKVTMNYCQLAVDSLLHDQTIVISNHDGAGCPIQFPK